MKLFFDTEFTGLNSRAQFISIGIVAEDGVSFYAEFTDFSNEVSSWIKNNVLNALTMAERAKDTVTQAGRLTEVKGDTSFVRASLLTWLTQFPTIEFWGDCLSHDWVLMLDLLARRDGENNPQLPDNLIVPYPRDLFDYFCEAGFSLEDAWGMSRAEYAQIVGHKKRNAHNALWDARAISACYEKLSDLIKTKKDIDEEIKTGTPRAAGKAKS